MATRRGFGKDVQRACDEEEAAMLSRPWPLTDPTAAAMLLSPIHP